MLWWRSNAQGCVGPRRRNLGRWFLGRCVPGERSRARRAPGTRNAHVGAAIWAECDLRFDDQPGWASFGFTRGRTRAFRRGAYNLIWEVEDGFKKDPGR